MKKAFTLIEILIVLAIISLVAVLAIPFYQPFQVRTYLDNNSQEIIQVLRKAQSKAMAGENDEVYGVHFSVDEYVLFKGMLYNPDDLENEIFGLPNSLSITNINLNGGGNEIIFDKLKGTTSNYGSIAATSISNESRTVSISKTGKIEIE